MRRFDGMQSVVHATTQLLRHTRRRHATTQLRRSLPFAVGMVVLAAGAASAQLPRDGRIMGRVLSAETGEPLSGVAVSVEGTGLGALSDVTGRYIVTKVPVGAHVVQAQNIGYATKRVTDVVITGGQVTSLDITLTPEAVALEALTVTAEAERGSSSSLLSQRQRSAGVVDAIGAEQIASSPDGDAAAALRRVPGMSVVDGKYVYVRGLGERYGATTLNGAPMPSPEADRKVVPLDIVPSSLLESVVTAKTYLPNQPGDYAGGLVQIQTRRFPTFRTVKFSATGGYTSNATFGEAMLSPASGSYDFFGFDDGTRGLPSMVPANQRLDRSTFSQAQLQAMGQEFGDGIWGPVAQDVPLNSSFGLSLGDEFRVGGRSLGFLAAGTLSNDYTAASDVVERVFSAAGGAAPEVDYTGTTGTHAVSLGGLTTLTYQLAPEHQVTAEAVYNRLTSEEARRLEGFNIDSNTNQLSTRLRYLAQTVLTGQLRGTHHLDAVAGAQVEWRAGVSRADRYEPNTREVLYRETDGTYYWDNFIQSGSNFFQEMTERGANGGLDVALPFRFRSAPAKLSLGGSLDLRTRDTYTRRFRFVPTNGSISDDVRVLGPNELFARENIGPSGFEIREATFNTDNYDAEQSIYAGYAMLDLELLPRLRVVAGARYETTSQEVTPFDLFDAARTPIDAAVLEASDILPALNLTYAVTDGMNLRLGASRTLARPQFRELAPFSFADYAGGYLTIGNPALDRTRITNLDARWEWFFRPGALLAVSGFYKQFEDPIETLVLPSTELIKTWVNAPEATNYGVELEARTDLGVLADALVDVSLNANLTLVASDVSTGRGTQVWLPGEGTTRLQMLEKDRALQGQSPYVVNLGASYAKADLGLTASVLFNRFGRRIDSVGAQELEDIYEEGRNQLDVTVEQRLARGVALKLSAARLLGNEVEFTQFGDLIRGYDLGRTLSLSVSWQLGR